MLLSKTLKFYETIIIAVFFTLLMGWAFESYYDNTWVVVTFITFLSLIAIDILARLFLLIVSIGKGNSNNSESYILLENQRLRDEVHTLRRKLEIEIRENSKRNDNRNYGNDYERTMSFNQLDRNIDRINNTRSMNQYNRNLDSINNTRSISNNTNNVNKINNTEVDSMHNDSKDINKQSFNGISNEQIENFQKLDKSEKEKIKKQYFMFKKKKEQQ